MKVLLIGASRGIGREFVSQYFAAGAQVTATARSATVADAVSASGLGWRVDNAAFDVAIVNAGVYGPRSAGLEAPTEADFDAVMHTNVLGAMRVVSQLADALAKGARLAVLSSQMGSIGTRSGTSGWLYRASKAALNSVLKDASIALAGRATWAARARPSRPRKASLTCGARSLRSRRRRPAAF
jgi:NAD(P)-dependent dehydrogenase (short-subunit alcohol dehydrogenase family)